jgi:hypothetical protein
MNDIVWHIINEYNPYQSITFQILPGVAAPLTCRRVFGPWSFGMRTAQLCSWENFKASLQVDRPKKHPRFC